MSDASNPLKGCRVLVLEDEYFLASDLEVALRNAGGVVLGPFGNLSEAMEQLSISNFDVAVVDINLRDDGYISGGRRIDAARNTVCVCYGL